MTTIFNELAGRCLVPAMAGGINFGSWWVSPELLCEGDLPLPPLELTPWHHMRVVEPRPGSHWQCDELAIRRSTRAGILASIFIDPNPQSYYDALPGST